MDTPPPSSPSPRRATTPTTTSAPALTRPRLTVFERLTLIGYVGNLIFLITLIVTRWSLTSSVSPWIDRGAMLAVSVAVGVLVAGLFSWHRSRREIEVLDFNVCLGCRHQLTEGQDSGACPECGTHFERNATRAAWMRHFHLVPRADASDRAHDHLHHHDQDQDGGS